MVYSTRIKLLWFQYCIKRKSRDWCHLRKQIWGKNHMLHNFSTSFSTVSRKVQKAFLVSIKVKVISWTVVLKLNSMFSSKSSFVNNLSFFVIELSGPMSKVTWNFNMAEALIYDTFLQNFYAILSNFSQISLLGAIRIEKIPKLGFAENNVVFYSALEKVKEWLVSVVITIFQTIYLSKS